MNSRSKKFFSYYNPYLGLLVADLGCALVVAAITLVLPLCARYIVEEIVTSGLPDALHRIYTMGMLMLALIIIHAVCNMFVDYQGHMMGAKMERDMRAELFAHYQKLPFSFFDNQKTGQLMNRISNDTFALGELYHHAPEDIVLTSIKFFGTFIILLTVNVELTLIIFAFLPLMAAYAFYFNRKMKIALRASKDRIAEINEQAEDTLAGIRVVKSFTNEAVENEKFAITNNRFLASRRAEYRSEGYFYNGMVAFSQLFTALVIVFGGATIVRGTLTVTDMVTYLLYIGLLLEPIGTALNFARLYNEGITGFERFMEMLEQKPEIAVVPEVPHTYEMEGRIQFDDVIFRYSDDQEHILEDVSLDIGAGEFVALVGPSGVGKTTLCSLIPRFYDVTGGIVKLDGQDVRELDLETLRTNIGIVQQDVYLFAGTIADNIRYGKPMASMVEIIAAAKQANAHGFIMALPAGYDTDIGQRGIKLSGGQKQRLTIARVFLKNPPIIIFDEATSALDNESEKGIQAALESLRKNRTTIVIAHRLSTVRNAHRIVILAENGIAEEGTHDALLARGGLYAQLYNQ